MNKLKRIVSVLALGSVIAINCMAEAYDSWSAVMNTRATAYTDSNLTKRNGVEYADKGDAVTVLDESPKAYLVRYPVSRGGYKERWVARTAVTGVSSSLANAASTVVKNAVKATQNNYQQWQGVAKYRAVAYTNSALSQRNGVEYVDKGDTVTVLNEEGNAYYVRYPLARGGTKERWVSKSAINKLVRGADALDQISSHAQNTANQAQSVQRTYGSWPAVMNRRAIAYTDENLTKRNGIEYADKGDAVTVLNESAKGYLVKYPLSKGGYKERWVARSAVTATSSTNTNTNTSASAIASAMQKAAQTAVNANRFSYFNANDTNVERPSDTNYGPWKGTANVRATAYLNSGLTQTSGIEWVGKGDILTVYGEQGNAYLVEYPVKNGTKHRWVRKGIIGTKSPSGMNDNTSYTNSTSDNVGYWNSRVGQIVADLSSSCYTSKNIFYQCGYKGQCTWYAHGRMQEVAGITLIAHNDAKTWGYVEKNDPNVYVDKTISSKCVAVNLNAGGGHGHVVFVEYVDDTNGNVYFTEDNFDRNTNLKVRKVPKSFFNQYAWFIHSK